jgi:hypothetical protein
MAGAVVKVKAHTRKKPARKAKAKKSPKKSSAKKPAQLGLF